jgi:hypothetical protein
MLENTIRDAENIKVQITTTVRDMELAMERDAQTRRAFAEAKRNYDDMEAEIKFELIHSAEGRNAEQRSAQVDVGLIRARADGALRGAWGRMLATQNEADAAKVALDQMICRFRAIEAVADLTTAQLRALSR